MGKIDCDYVLANINPDIIYGRMMPKELVPEREKKLSAARGKPLRRTHVHGLLLLRQERGGAGHKGLQHIPARHVRLGEGIQEHHERHGHERLFDLPVLQRDEPGVLPGGDLLCSFTTFGSPVDWNDLKQEDYFRFKNDRGEEDAGRDEGKDRHRPHRPYRGNGRGIAVDLCKISGHAGGSVYGYETTDWDGMMAR